MEEDGEDRSIRLTMKDHLDESVRLAEEVNILAKLVRIFGAGIHGDGMVHFTDAMSYIPRWEYAFVVERQDDPPRWITVMYWKNDMAKVDPNAGNCSEREPIDDQTLMRLPDSDDLVRFFHSQGKKELRGHDNDVLVVSMERMMAPQCFIQNWNGEILRLDPTTKEIF